MGARKQQPEAEGFRRRKTCVVCAAPLEQPREGRPRVLCASPACERARRQQLRGRDRSWWEEDWREAALAFHDRCAFCRRGGDLRPSRFHLPPVPACAACYRDSGRQLSAPLEALRKLAVYLAGASRGVPLPRPYRKDGQG